MFGRVTLTLQVGATGAFRIPSAAFDRARRKGGKASVRVVRDDKVCLVPVRYGADNGSEVEVLSGLTRKRSGHFVGRGPVAERHPGRMPSRGQAAAESGH